MSRAMRILVVDDHADMVSLLGEALRGAGYEVIEATSGAQALDLARTTQPDAAISDLRMAGVDGLDVLAGLHELDSDLPVLMMTAFGSVTNAVDAMRRGAWSYLTKPLRIDELLLQVRNALEHRALRDENRSLRKRVAAEAPDGMIGHSAPMRALYELVARLADAEDAVLIRGESGTGKERVAQALHQRGRRREAPFVAVNCASMPASLLESELFGHAKGSFTGAAGPRRGLFLQADGGTLFLDEIGDMPIELQAHLLRVLEEKVVRPVGADTGRRVDVRIVAATNQDLEQRVAGGRFRADLFYRLDVVPIVVAPLRERIEDLPELFAYFASRATSSTILRLAPPSLAMLERYAWPGNVRELENLVRRLAILVDHPEVLPDDLRLHAQKIVSASVPTPPPLERARSELPTLRQVELDYMSWVIESCGGNKTRAAEILGIDVSTIHRRIRGPDTAQ
jgi:two-component system, NtrC family, response regulator HydG